FDTQLIRVKDVGNQLERSTDRTHKTDREMSICEMQEESRLAVADHRRGQAALQRTLVEITRVLALGEPAPSRSEADTMDVAQADGSFGLGSLYCRAIALITPSEPEEQGPAPDESLEDTTAAGAVSSGAGNGPETLADE